MFLGFGDNYDFSGLLFFIFKVMNKMIIEDLVLGLVISNGLYWFLLYLFKSMNNRRQVRYKCAKCKKRIPNGDLHYVVFDGQVQGHFYCRDCYLKKLTVGYPQLRRRQFLSSW